MSLWDTLKGAIVEDEPPAAAPARTSAPPAAPGPRTIAHAPPAPPVVNEPDPVALARLQQTLQKATPQNYAAFLEAYDLLADAVPEEGMRLKAAVKTSKSTGSALSEAIGQLLKLVTVEREMFEKSFRNKKSGVLQALQTSVSQIDEGIRDREQQIATLQEECSTLRIKRDDQNTQIGVEEQRLDDIHNGFIAATEHVTTALHTQQSRIDALGAA